MGKTEKQGCFAVRFVKDSAIGVMFELTGDHWKAEDLDVAKAVVGEDCRRAIINHEPPTYLIPERVMKCAMEHRDEPGIVTQILINAVELGADDNTKRVYNSVIQSLGGTVLDISWGSPMSDEEVQEVFETFGLKAKAGYNESNVSNEE